MQAKIVEQRRRTNRYEAIITLSSRRQVIRLIRGRDDHLEHDRLYIAQLRILIEKDANGLGGGVQPV